MQTPSSSGQATVLKSLLDVAISLSAEQDRKRMLDIILREAPGLMQADAGSLYILQDGQLEFAVAQNDSLTALLMQEGFLSKRMPVSADSLAGFVASTGRVVCIRDAYSLPEGAPFRIDRRFDAATGYRTRSVLGIPLKCPDGQCVGVLELINRTGDDGCTAPFPSDEGGAILSLASMAAVTIHNALLQEQVKKAHLDTIIRLSVAAEFRDDDTGMHVRRMSRCSALVATAMGMREEEVELIRYASPMHDIGKIGIPDAVLLKKGPLLPKEREEIKRHTTIGARILEGPRCELISLARDVALTHHEKWNGTGYPAGLAGENIPLAGRVVGLADMYDALVSRRCYKEPFPVEKALRIIRHEDGRHFDPRVVKAFFDVVGQVLELYRSHDVPPLA